MPEIFNKEAFQNTAIPVDPKFLSSVERCLVLAPHQDDESLGCGGLIAYLKDHGKQVKVTFTTNGGASHLHSKSFPQDRLVEVRRQEAISALQILGVDHTDITFLNGPDSNLPSIGEDGFESFAEQIRRITLEFKPELILVPYELDPHRDHRATWNMLMQATKELPQITPMIWEYPIWLYQNASLEDLPQLKSGELKSLDVSKYITLKENAISAHLSQTTDLIADDPSGFRLMPAMIDNFISGKEFYMQRVKLNLGGTLSSSYFEHIYDENNDPWDFETSEYEKAKYAHTIQSLGNKYFSSGLEIGCSIGVLTEMLAEHCDRLLSIDISSKALETAKKRLESNPKVDFRVAAIPDGFPEGTVDLIVMSEVGYYLSLGDLKRSIDCIEEQLLFGGTLLIIHWTHYVKDYPLTGDEVHEAFSESKLKHLHGDRTKDYRLDVYEKL
jgi:LmbE family N-acetylglucosaminyl deacetylase